ncbi:hypothetical protein I33_2992 [Bacillus subtilis subsp. subtilis str. RO-NN-1]|nr:hypothetical protein I33_2992 [Bacillus subtilis subsp. subtilis str. RO-NN-1]
MSHMNTSQSNVAAFNKVFLLLLYYKRLVISLFTLWHTKKLSVQTAYSAGDEDS